MSLRNEESIGDDRGAISTARAIPNELKHDHSGEELVSRQYAGRVVNPSPVCSPGSATLRADG